MVSSCHGSHSGSSPWCEGNPSHTNHLTPSLAVLDHSAIGKVYQYLHAPVDRIIYDRGKETLEVTPPNGAWSTLGGADYRQYQTQLREAIKDKAWDCVMDWEADAWTSEGEEPAAQEP
ncbi:hypothetical protein GCM10027031_14260 [Corynebacterium atrinae]